MIEPQILSDYEALSRRAAEWVATRLRERPTALMSLAAGSTPSRTYQLLAEHAAIEPALCARCRLLKLDEWGGLAMNDPATCEHQLRSLLVTPLDAAARYTAFESNPSDPVAESARVATWLRSNGPIDICILGLGVNGHIGFNEPSDLLEPHAHVAQLSKSSLGHAMVQDCDERPTYGLTLGMADLLQSREVLLLVSGASKRGPLKRLLAGQISTTFPASILHLHPRVTLLADADACLT